MYVCMYLISQITFLLSKQKISYWIFIKHCYDNEIVPLEKFLEVWRDKLKKGSRHYLRGPLLVNSINNTLRWTLQKQISLNKTESKEGGGLLIRKSLNHPHKNGWWLLKLHTKPSEFSCLGKRINPGCEMWVVFPITAQVIYQSTQTMCVVRHDFTSKTKGGCLPSVRRWRVFRTLQTCVEMSNHDNVRPNIVFIDVDASAAKNNLLSIFQNKLETSDPSQTKNIANDWRGAELALRQRMVFMKTTTVPKYW